MKKRVRRPCHPDSDDDAPAPAEDDAPAPADDVAPVEGELVPPTVDIHDLFGSESDEDAQFSESPSDNEDGVDASRTMHDAGETAESVAASVDAPAQVHQDDAGDSTESRAEVDAPTLAGYVGFLLGSSTAAGAGALTTRVIRRKCEEKLNLEKGALDGRREEIFAVIEQLWPLVREAATDDALWTQDQVVCLERGLGKLDELDNQDSCIYRESKKRVDALEVQFKSKDFIDVPPVYLGSVKEYRNLAQLTKSGAMSKRIQKDFHSMPESDYKFHPLRHFFEKRDDGAQGYEGKMLRTGPTGKGRELMLDVDHVVPARWAGLDHPRNFVVMHRSMNRAFGSQLPETKWAYLERRSSNILRATSQFLTEVKESEPVKRAVKDYIANVGREGGLTPLNY
jgi:hypothetical protein